MSEPKPPVIPPPPPLGLERKINAHPSFLGALRGVWRMTWRSQVAWRRLPGQIGLLLILPALIWITTYTKEGWSRHVGDRYRMVLPQFEQFFDEMQGTKSPLKPTQQEAISTIFHEEYRAASSEFRAAQVDEDKASRTQRERDIAATCANNILHRAREVLDDAQYEHFQPYEAERRKRMDARITDNEAGWNRSEPFYHWLIEVYFFLLLPLACVRGCGALMRDELQADTLGFLVSRPVSRARLLCVKYISQLAWLEVLMLVETLLIFGVGQEKQIPDLWGGLPLFAAAQALAVAAWSALGTLLGQVTSRYMAFALVYGGVVEMGIGRIPNNINLISMMRHLKTLLSHNGALQNIYDWPADGLAVALAALIIAPMIFLGLAALLFSVVEYLPASEMQK